MSSLKRPRLPKGQNVAFKKAHQLLFCSQAQPFESFDSYVCIFVDDSILSLTFVTFLVNILFHLGRCRVHCIQESQRTYWTSWADLWIWWSQERIWGVWREESQSWRKFSTCISEEEDYCDGKKAEERAKGRSWKTPPFARSTGIQPEILYTLGMLNNSYIEQVSSVQILYICPAKYLFFPCIEIMSCLFSCMVKF